MSFGDRWVDASFMLPSDIHLPVEVRLVTGKTAIIRKMEGDWRPVVAWRKWKREAT